MRADPTIPPQVEADVIPHHYSRGGFECFDVIDALKLSFLLGCAFKYLWRADHKGSPADALADLRKARSCIDRKISRREREQ